MDKQLSKDDIKPKALYDSYYKIDCGLGFSHKRYTPITVFKDPDKGSLQCEYKVRLDPIPAIIADDKIVPVKLINHSNFSNFILGYNVDNVEIPYGVKNYFLQCFNDKRSIIITDIPIVMLKPFSFTKDIRIFGIKLSGPDYEKLFVKNKTTFMTFESCLT